MLFKIIFKYLTEFIDINVFSNKIENNSGFMNGSKKCMKLDLLNLFKSSLKTCVNFQCVILTIKIWSFSKKFSVEKFITKMITSSMKPDVNEQNIKFVHVLIKFGL